jgi:hypothetical protein
LITVPEMVEEGATDALSPKSLGEAPWKWELFRTEYGSLREESARAHDSQHHIVQWSLTAYGVLFLTALALSDAQGLDGPTLEGRLDPYVMQLGFFVLVLPLLLTASMLVWLAELYRIERVGAYLRSRERCWSEGSFPSELARLDESLSSRQYPLLWENKIHGPGKELRNFSTGFLLYGAALVFALAVYVVDVWSPANSLIFELFATLVGLGVLILYSRLIPWKFMKDIDDIRRLFPEDERPNPAADPCYSKIARAFFKLIGLSALCPRDSGAR